ncbi:calcitonin gene-related peptide type 1 receptor-like isoform X1 [Mercenaria mercenaria]|uniref:calcitonin gene-related peptide type 1 receptor-like isoform X1 n=1 Tax=Mercenaria mercenaria TaxID=6596 RepID=UPI00234EF465|nr:calcitonin gene-related peptide type 1 receptor-like isoform X1 [Mercenaria mercenaria]
MMKGIIFISVWICLDSKFLCLAQQCRSKFGIFTPEDFDLHACVWCYYFLYPEYVFKPHPYQHYLVLFTNSSQYPIYSKVRADIHNTTSVNIICSSLTSDECDRWKLCCETSHDCCRRQQNTHSVNLNETCSPTWDGYGCWDQGTPGQTSHISCPVFLQFAVPTKSALKECQPDGTWLKRDKLEWTDYTPCLNYKELKTTIYISLGCQIASLICLIPSVIIFFQFRSLIHQHRIRLHINFFISFILSGTFIIVWNTTVTYDRITNTNVSDTLLYKNSAQCKLLSFLKLYFTSTNFAWMFCEGLYLYRLIVNAFSPPKRLLPFYILGWGIPLFFTSVYATVRLIQANESCWAESIGNKEWIIYTPNLFCLAANVFFLCSILRILLTQLQVHPNEPSNFRKALKATFVLIPLFGVQLVVTIYRMPPESSGSLHYERFNEFVTNSQGMCVALIFCLCNGEVTSLMMHSFRRRRDTMYIGSKKEHTAISMNNTVTSRYHSTTDKGSPSKTLILCYKKGNGETTSF